METKTNTVVGKKLQGKVVGINSEKTVKVEVETKKSHPLYGKIIKSHKRYLVHNDPENGIGVDGLTLGDIVVIQEHKPISKRKSFILLNKIEKE